jgi:7-dehydrocholesterol reductase
VYVSHSYFLARLDAPRDISLPLAAALLLLGLLSIYVNYEADWQRKHAREAHPGASIWGQPASVILAKYKAGRETKTSILLVSGWWGMARHFHYLPEILAAAFWSAPAALASDNKLIPLFYVGFLTVLLVDRAYRDEARCADKYGSSWKKYTQLVPYKIIPGVFCGSLRTFQKNYCCI